MYDYVSLSETQYRLQATACHSWDSLHTHIERSLGRNRWHFVLVERHLKICSVEKLAKDQRHWGDPCLPTWVVSYLFGDILWRRHVAFLSTYMCEIVSKAYRILIFPSWRIWGVIDLCILADSPRNRFFSATFYEDVILSFFPCKHNHILWCKQQGRTWLQLYV